MSRNEEPVILALHSSGGSGKHWSGLASRFAGAAKVLSLDFHDHGTGPAWRGAPHLIGDADTARVVAHLEELGGAHVVGHSYGGAVALRVALARPDLVRSLILHEPVAFGLLLDYNPRHRAAAEIVHVGNAVAGRVKRGDLGGAAEVFLSYWIDLSAWDALGAAQRATLAARMPAIQGHFESLFRTPQQLMSVRGLRMPALLVDGARPRLPVARILELLRFALPLAEIATLPGGGHMAPVTRAAAFCDLVERFHVRLGTVKSAQRTLLAAA